MTILILGCHTSPLPIDSSWNILMKPQRCAWFRGDIRMAVLELCSRWQDTWVLNSTSFREFYTSPFLTLNFLIFLKVRGVPMVSTHSSFSRTLLSFTSSFYKMKLLMNSLNLSSISNILKGTINSNTYVSIPSAATVI